MRISASESKRQVAPRFQRVAWAGSLQYAHEDCHKIRAFKHAFVLHAEARLFVSLKPRAKDSAQKRFTLDNIA